MPRTAPLWAWLSTRWRGLVLPGLVALLMLYTVDQLLTGERGMVTWRVMQNQVTQLKADIAMLEADNTRLNANIDRLKGPLLPDGTRGAPDKDFMDELLRRDLGLLKPGEVMILTSPTDTE